MALIPRKWEQLAWYDVEAPLAEAAPPRLKARPPPPTETIPVVTGVVETSLTSFGVVQVKLKNQVISLDNVGRVKASVDDPQQDPNYSKYKGLQWIRLGSVPRGQFDPFRGPRCDGRDHTMAACEDEGYMLDGKRIQLSHIKEMLDNTKIVQTAPQQAPGSGRGGGVQGHRPGKLLEVAFPLASGGLATVAINAASAYHVGGGFETGGRHALEESICCIVSPNVEVFRGGTDEGYPFLPEDKKFRLHVISIAMPNRNTQVRDAPMDAPADQEEYEDLVLKKFDTRTRRFGPGPVGCLICICIGFMLGSQRLGSNMIGDTVNFFSFGSSFCCMWELPTQ
eukprot:Skav208834  [mRNA]  locus=scaffold1193:85657:91051:+ [translate_table: standard]